MTRGQATIEDDGDTDSDGPAEEKADATPVRSATVAYIVRAVTPGTFVHPAATVEDMYRPDRYARTAAGKLTVTARSETASPLPMPCARMGRGLG